MSETTMGGTGSQAVREPGGLHQAERELLEAAESNDYTTGIVPLDKRRTILTMTLLWASLQASVSFMYTTYLARSGGLDLAGVLWAGVISLATMLAYGYGAASLGAYTGQTHTLLTRAIFGRVGSWIVSALLIIMGMGWYGFQAYFLALILQGLFGFTDLTAWSVGFAIVMIFNNLFGFRGVVTYSRYVAGPVLVLWGLYAMIRGFFTVPSNVLFSSPHTHGTITILVLAGLIIGGAMWGNEPDLYRYGKRSPTASIPPLFFGYLVGCFVFPLAGYLMAELSTASAFGPVMKYFVTFSLFGFTALAVVVFFINQFALNDGNLYESINALQNILGGRRIGGIEWKRTFTVLVFGAIGAILAATMVNLQNNFFIVAGISAVLVPCATVIMVMDTFVVPRFFNLKRPIDRVTPWQFTAPINWIGVIALAAGVIVGSYTGGLIPNTPGFGTTFIGYPALQAWALSAVLYLIGVWIAVRSPNTEVLLGWPRRPAEEPSEAVDTAGAVATGQ